MTILLFLLDEIEVNEHEPNMHYSFRLVLTKWITLQRWR